MAVTGEIQGVKRFSALPDFSAFGVETIRVHDHPDFAGLKVFQCVRLSATITPKSCSSNYARAECSSVCFRCPIGKHHSATHETNIAPSMKREFGTPARDAGLSCIRCGRTERTATKHIGRFRLVKQHTVCVSCANREYEKIKGLNSKGAKPVKWSHLKQATITIETDSGEWKTLDIGLRAGRGECERYVERVHSGCELIEVFIDGEAIPEGTPDAEPNKSRSWRERSASETAAEADERVHDDRDAADFGLGNEDWGTPLHKVGKLAPADTSTADGNGTARRHGWLPPLSEEDDAAYRASFEAEILADFGYPYDLADFVAWLTQDWPQFERSPIIVKRASARPTPLYFGKSIGEWASAWGVTAEAAAERLKDQLDDSAALDAMRETVELSPMGEASEPDPLDVLNGEGGMQYAPVEPSASVAEPEALPKVAQPVQQPARAPEPVSYDMKTRAGRRAFEKAARKQQKQQRGQSAQGFPSIANTARAFVQVLFEQGKRS